MTDITEPKRIREALTAAHERFMTVLEGLDDAISVTADTHDGLELLFANRTYRRVFGAQTGGHDELLAGRRGCFTDESVEVFAPRCSAGSRCTTACWPGPTAAACACR